MQLLDGNLCSEQIRQEITQKVDAAAMALYMGFYNFSTDIKLVDTTNAANRGKARVDDLNVFYTGATINF